MKGIATKYNTIATGFAMFSMFFGAGNVVFPLELGDFARDKNLFAILGLLITAVGIPFIGLMGMTLFEGSYKAFFDRIGKVPGFLVALGIMCLIGPFGAIPRCIALSYSTVKIFFPSVSLVFFSVLSCLLIFLLTIKRNRIVDILGYLLTPVLLLSLGVIVIKGFLTSPAAPVADHQALGIFIYGMKEGYQTMDLMGAFFFSSVVLICLKKDVDTTDESNYKKMIGLTLQASCIGASLLALIYIGFSYIAAFNSQVLVPNGQAELLGTMALHILGPYAGIVACAAVALACLTTAIALSSVAAEFLHEDLSFEKVGYATSLIIVLIITFLVSMLNFTAIVKMLLPILQICYPALIVLTVLNIANKLFGVKMVKTPVFATFAISLIVYFL